MFPFDYELPANLIAQEPCEPRDHSRLMVLRRQDNSLEHRYFFDLPALLDPGDLLILNDTRVLPARLLGHRTQTGGKWEGLFLRELPDRCWEMLCQTGGALRENETIDVAGGMTLQLVNRLPNGRWKAQPLSDQPAIELLERFGHIPLPPYIRKGVAAETDRERYQTIFAHEPGAVAAPTAGLHFTQRILAALQEREITWKTVTLHVGLGTFQPIQVDDYTQHPMHTEWGRLTSDAADAINACKKRGNRVVAVGTTAVRVLETAA